MIKLTCEHCGVVLQHRPEAKAVQCPSCKQTLITQTRPVPPSTATVEAAASVQRISCSQCGKRLTFKAGAKGVKCPGCQKVTLVKDIPVAKKQAEKVAAAPVPEATTAVEVDVENAAVAPEAPCTPATTAVIPAPAAQPAPAPPAPQPDPTALAAPPQAKKKDLPQGVDVMSCQTCQAQLPYARAATFVMCPTCRSMNDTRKASETRPASEDSSPVSNRSYIPSQSREMPVPPLPADTQEPSFPICDSRPGAGPTMHGTTATVVACERCHAHLSIAPGADGLTCHSCGLYNINLASSKPAPENRKAAGQHDSFGSGSESSRSNVDSATLDNSASPYASIDAAPPHGVGFRDVGTKENAAGSYGAHDSVLQSGNSFRDPGVMGKPPGSYNGYGTAPQAESPFRESGARELAAGPYGGPAPVRSPATVTTVCDKCHSQLNHPADAKGVRCGACGWVVNLMDSTRAVRGPAQAQHAGAPVPQAPPPHFSSPAAQPPAPTTVVCPTCRHHLHLPAGAAGVRCPTCRQVISASQPGYAPVAVAPPAPPGPSNPTLACTGCHQHLGYAAGARAVRCSSCRTVNQVQAAPP